jgi:hypothetical protein
MYLIGDTFPQIESDELLFNIALPELARPTPVINATSMLMRQALSMSLFPLRKRFMKMTGEHNLYNWILNYVEENGLGWTPQHIDYEKEFLSHSTATFWSTNDKARCLIFI